MSGAALAWALKQPVPMSSAKFVLVVMADQTTSDLAFMSLAALSKATAQDRKTIVAGLNRLIEWGLIEDTGEKRGRTGQIPVYRLLMGEGLFDVAPFDKKHAKSGTVPKTEPVPKTEGNSTVFPIEQSQKRDTDPKLTQNDPSLSPRAQEPEPLDPPREPSKPSPGALATIAMRKAGMPASRLNPSHAELLAALDAGVTPAELADVVSEYLARGTGPPSMTYVIRTALGRRRDAASQPAYVTVHASTKPPPASAIDRVVAGIRKRRESAGAVPPGG